MGGGGRCSAAQRRRCRSGKHRVRQFILRRRQQWRCGYFPLQPRRRGHGRHLHRGRERQRRQLERSEHHHLPHARWRTRSQCRAVLYARHAHAVGCGPGQGRCRARQASRQLHAGRAGRRAGMRIAGQTRTRCQRQVRSLRAQHGGVHSAAVLESPSRQLGGSVAVAAGHQCRLRRLRFLHLFQPRTRHQHHRCVPLAQHRPQSRRLALPPAGRCVLERYARCA